MNPERWQIVREIFSQAAEQGGGERRAYLDAACAGDPELRREVDSLLESHGTANAVVDRPAADYVDHYEPVAEEARWIGRRIGAYELLSVLGVGGMGAVYRARRADSQYEKEVAIKLVRGGLGTDALLKRFRSERQILAGLDHPNIARLIDGGATEEGVPYLVMELVDGRPIDRYCEEENLPIAARLRLFLGVCGAVSYAHQRLVVHRDLKPNNILVTAAGTVKLLDFGIAKLLQATPDGQPADATVTAFIALTPAFSSPEQILGLQITTASDVYSLGVVLFHLLTGRSPYAGTLQSTRDAIQAVCETDVKAPSAIASPVGATPAPRELPTRDLDDIALKALRKEPSRRYQSAEQLSEDLERYLSGRPVLAHGDRASYRAGKFIRRHKLEIAAAVLIGLSLLGGVIASTYQARIARAEKVRAERDFARARKLANALMFEVHDSILTLPGATATRKLLVNDALQYLAELSSERSDDPTLNTELAIAYRKVGEIQGGANSQNLAQFDAAIDSFGKSVALLERVAATNRDDPGTLMELGQSVRSMATTGMFVGKFDAAVAGAARAVDLLTRAAARAPGRADVRHGLNAALLDQCYLLTAAGHAEEGLRSCRKAIPLQEELVRSAPANRTEQRWLGIAYGRTVRAINQLYFRTKEHGELLQEAVQLQRRGTAIDAELLRTNDKDELAMRDLTTDHNAAAETYYLLHDRPRSIFEWKAAIEMLDRVVAGDPANRQARLNTLLLRRNLGEGYLASGQWHEAIATFGEVTSTIAAMTVDPSDNVLRGTQAAAWDGLGDGHVLAAEAKGTARAVRLEHWRAARQSYGEAKRLISALKGEQGLASEHVEVLDLANKGLAQSEAEIKKLQSQ